MARLAMLAFRDVLVTPYTDLLHLPWGGEYHRGGPHWPEWSTQTAARHCFRGEPRDTEPLQREPTSALTGPIAWGGGVTRHYGHQITDFTSRLLPTLAETPDVRFAFGTLVSAEPGSDDATPEFPSIEDTPEFFREILDWYGIAGERVDIITEPTQVEHLFVAPQAEQRFRPGPEPWYLDLLDANTAARLGDVEQSGSLYVSRAGERARFAGEAYLERVLEQAGFRVLRAETVPVEQKMQAYAGAAAIVFAEGSGIHGAQLMGRALGDVTVLNRRPGHKVTQALVTPRARSLRYVDAVRGLVHGLDPAGNPAPQLGLTILDPELLLATLPIGHLWDPQAYAAARDADVEEWLETERASDRWAVPGSRELVNETYGSWRDSGQ
jgi:hypothetical protein